MILFTGALIEYAVILLLLKVNVMPQTTLKKAKDHSCSFPDENSLESPTRPTRTKV